MTDTIEDIPAEDTMAAELALNLLDGEARATALRRLLAEPAFSVEVEGWRTRLAPLHAEVTDVAPPADIWPRIEGALAAPAASADGSIVTRLNRWRALGLASSAIAASLAAVMLLTPAPEPMRIAPAPLLVAQIAGENAGPVLLASYDTGSRRFRLAPAALPASGVSPELWLIPADGKPRSLGIFDPEKQTDLSLPEPMIRLVGKDTVIAISLEPVGGSPTGQPTGPVVATGKMQPI